MDSYIQVYIYHVNVNLHYNTEINDMFKTGFPISI